MKPLEERITYSVICEQMPEPKVYHSSFNEAVEWAKSDQPLYRPYYIVGRVEHFEICGVVGDKAEGEK